MYVFLFSTRQAEKLRFLYYPIADRADILGMVNIDGSMTSNAGSWTGISSMVAHLLTVRSRCYIKSQNITNCSTLFSRLVCYMLIL